MKKTIPFILLGGLAVALGLWLWQNPRTNDQAQNEPTSPARLIADDPQAEADHIPRGKLTHDRIEETSSVVALAEGESLWSTSPAPAAASLTAASGETQNEQEIPADEVIVMPEPDAAVSASASSETEGPPRIAVLPFKLLGSENVFEKGTGEILCDALTTEIDSKVYEVYERDRLTALLAERGFQQSLLVRSPTAAARAGRLAGVHYIVLGSLARLGGQYYLSARLVDCRTGKIGQGARVEFQSMRQWSTKIAELVNLLGLRRGAGKMGQTADPVTSNQLLSEVNSKATFHVHLKTAQEKETYLEGETIQFVVSSDRSCYVTLITVDSEGHMTLLYPNPWHPDAFLMQGRELKIPSADMGFQFPITPPYGETFVKVIATLQPLRLNEGKTSNMEGKKFAGLSRGVKAIGLEPVGGLSSVKFDQVQSIATALSPNEWATDELMIITAGKKPQEPNEPNTGTTTETSVSGGTGDPFDWSPVGDTLNGKILRRFRELTLYALESPSLVLQPPHDPVARTREKTDYLIFHRGQKGFGKVTFTSSQKPPEGSDGSIVVPNLRLASYGLPPTHLVEVQWALLNRFKPGVDMAIAEHYEANMKRPTALIGLVDGAVDWADARIRHAAWTNADEIPDNHQDDDENGYVDDIHGWNFVDDNNRLCQNPYQFNHGTALVSLIAGKATGSDYDVVGIAPQAKIVTALVLAGSQSSAPWLLTSTLDRVIEGITYVADQGAKIINCSFGTQVSRETLDSLNRIPLWDRLEVEGVTLICAAGNDHIDIDQQPVFPASLPRTNIIAVGATNAAGQPGTQWDASARKWMPFSNYGPETIEITAPGSLILAATSRGKANLLNGTSFAAVMVTAKQSLGL